MQNVSICLSGHPRTFLEHQSTWSRYVNLIRSEYQVFIYFHAWAQQGLVRTVDGNYVEGSYDIHYYQQTQALIDELKPNAFAIESVSPELDSKAASFPPVLLSSWQAGRKKILSQLYSIGRADLLGQRFEQAKNIKSDVVVKLRFDALPHNLTLNEIRYVAQHPYAKVLFAPSPLFHIHPGGGGGCQACHAFFDAHWLQDGFQERTDGFLASHTHHTNDICDLFAVGSPQVMERYARLYDDAEVLLTRMMQSADRHLVADYRLAPDADDERDSRIVGTASTTWDIEKSPIFIPEKLIRYQMSDLLVIHGETMAVIQRR